MEITADGIHGMLPRENMDPSAVKLRDVFAMKPDAPIVMREFGFFSQDRWKKEEGVEDIRKIMNEMGIGYQCADPGQVTLYNMGGCEAQFCPKFETKVLEDRGDHELCQDFAGRKVLYFKGRRNGFMPSYVDHPVKDLRSFEENCRWRLDPDTPARIAETEKRAKNAVPAAMTGKMVEAYIGGAYMYLRSLIGPEGLLYMFYDDPETIHACMRQWYELNTKTTAIYQQYVTIDDILFDEDICYKGGLLISPAMWHEFIKPYYQQLLSDIKSRQLDRNRHLYVQIATDGNCVPAIPLYREIGMDVMSPFEVASGCDVVKIGRDNPDLIMFGGIDKRILAQGKDAIDREIERIMPVMKKRGGYIPTCDHGVPEEVTFENWLHFRRRLAEYAD